MAELNLIMLEANFQKNPNSLPPDAFNISNKELPKSDFVVSRNSCGEVISVYGDPIWDFTLYNFSNTPCLLYFQFWNNGSLTQNRINLINEIKHILFIIIWLKDNKPLSFGSLKNYLTVCRVIATFSEKNSLKISDVISNKNFFLEFIKSQKSGWLVETLTSLIRLIRKIKYKELTIETIDLKTIELLKKQNIQYRSNLQQTMPIPSRIYSQIILNIVNYLEEWKSVKDEIFQTLHNCYAIKKEKYSTGINKNYERFYKKNLENASPNLKKYIISKNNNFYLKSISSSVKDIQYLCKILIHIFTGMRDEEVLNLSYNCIEKKWTNGQIHYLIVGMTSKISNGVKTPTKWVTSIEGYEAVLIAREIADNIYKLFNDLPNTTPTDRLDYPLFVSTSYFSFSTQSIKSKGNKYRTGSNQKRTVIDGITPLLEEADLKELEMIDPHRLWLDGCDLEIGKLWPLKSHQFRRSLALYAHKSGLVSLPSLRRQLQHITNEMSAYYANGSAFAINLIGNNQSHFAHEWQKTQYQSSALGYIFNVLNSDSLLYGGHIHWIENNLNKQNGILNVDRKQTLKRFKDGEIFYKETLLGGCTKIGSCNMSAINWLNINCLKRNCRHLIVNLPKLQKVIAGQEKMLNFLDITSVEYRTELSNLETLKNIETYMLEKKDEPNAKYLR